MSGVVCNRQATASTLIDADGIVPCGTAAPGCQDQDQGGRGRPVHIPIDHVADVVCRDAGVVLQGCHRGGMPHQRSESRHGRPGLDRVASQDAAQGVEVSPTALGILEGIGGTAAARSRRIIRAVSRCKGRTGVRGGFPRSQTSSSSASHPGKGCSTPRRAFSAAGWTTTTGLSPSNRNDSGVKDRNSLARRPLHAATR